MIKVEMMRWVDERANRETTREINLSRKKLINQMIWSSDLLAEFCLTTSSFDSLCMNDSTSNRICLFETIRIVDSSSICWLRIESFYSHSIEMISFRIYWFSRLSRDQWVRRWICDSDEIRSKWQRETKMSWSEEKILVTNEDLGPQMNLDGSGDEDQ
jgi:hypothetical protein